MTDRELQERLRDWYRAEVADVEGAPPELRARVAAIPRAPRGRLFDRRNMILLAAAAVLTAFLIGGAIAAGSGMMRLPALFPHLSIATSSPSPVVDAQVSRLEIVRWALDFKASGLSTEATPAYPGLWSTLQFAHGRLLGGTGHGGGCDLFDATYEAHASALVTTLASTGSGCAPGSGPQIRDRISRVVAFALAGCHTYDMRGEYNANGRAYPKEMTWCNTLTLLDGRGRVLLVYAAVPPTMMYNP